MLTAPDLDLPPTRRSTPESRPDPALRRSAGFVVRSRWIVTVTVALWTAYSAVGVWLVHGRDTMIGDAISRTLTAKLMVLSRDPHLAAVGFYWMPIPTVTRIPFVYVLDPWGEALLAGPFTSALFAAATVPVLIEIARTVSAPRWATVVVVGAYALGPVTFFLAADGMSESTFGFFLALAVLYFLRWRALGDSRHLLALGLAIGACTACRYETLVVLPAFAAAVALAVPRDRRRSAITLTLVPATVVLVAWATISRLITGQWFYWYWASRPTTATPEGAQWVPEDLGPASASMHVITLLLAYSPALIPFAVAAVALPHRRATWTLLGGIALLLPAVLAGQLSDGSTWMVPRFLVHTPLVGAMGALIVAGVAGDARIGAFVRLRDRLARVAAWTTVVAVPLGAVTATLYLADDDRAHAEGEYIFLGAVLGRDDPRAAPGFDDRNEVFFADLEPFRDLVADLDPLLAEGRNVVMDSLQAIPVVLSSHADRFIVPEDRDFEEILSDPVGRFEYIVVLPGRAQTDFSALIADELARESGDGGTWVRIGDYAGSAELYEFRPD